MVTNRMKSLKQLVPLGLGCLLMAHAVSQTPQILDAERMLQDSLTREFSPPLSIPIEAQALSDVTSGGAEVLVQRIQFDGLTQFGYFELLAVLGEGALGQSYDLGGLRRLANEITEFYRAQGFTFARAFIPAQTLEGGVLRIQILEGRYGDILVDSEDPRIAERVAEYLAPLVPGEVIEDKTLQRTFALLGDVPGLEVVPLINTGQTVGTGDILVLANRDAVNRLRLSADNHGNRFSGAYRASFSFVTPMLLRFGDTLTLTGMASNEELKLISGEYSLPVVSSGLRFSASYSWTDYDLGGLQDPIVETTGGSEVVSVRLSYPWVRTSTRDIQISAGHQRKWLATDTTFTSEQVRLERVEASLLPLALTWQERDSWNGGGVSQASLSVTLGHTVRRASETFQNNEITHRDFAKTEFQFFRLQTLPYEGVDARFFGLFSSQFATRSLDSSEGFSLGGPNGVRAYPQGESSGSQGWLTQLELRATWRSFEPFVFYDLGHIIAAPDEPSSTLQGAGFGMRSFGQQISTNFALAWKVDPQDATSDQRQRNPRAWFSLNYQL